MEKKPVTKPPEEFGTVEYRAWRRAPFPEGVEDEELSDLAADYTMLDVAAADYLIPLVEQGVRVELHPDLLERIQALAERAHSLAARNDEFARKGQEYVDQIDLLLRVLTHYVPN